MAAPLNIGMPTNIDVKPGYSLRVTAIDPTTGNGVAGTSIQIMVIEAEALGTDLGELAVGPFMLVPGPNA